MLVTLLKPYSQGSEMEAGGMSVWVRMAAQTRLDLLRRSDSTILEGRANTSFTLIGYTSLRGLESMFFGRGQQADVSDIIRDQRGKKRVLFWPHEI